MTVPVAIRLGVTGEEDVKRAFSEIGRDGGSALASVGTALERLGDLTDEQVEKLGTLSSAVLGVAAKAASGTALQGIVNLARGFTDTARAAKALSDTSGGVVDTAAGYAVLSLQLLRVRSSSAGTFEKLQAYSNAFLRAKFIQDLFNESQRKSIRGFLEQAGLIEKATEEQNSNNDKKEQGPKTLAQRLKDLAQAAGLGLGPFALLIDSGGRLNTVFNVLKRTIVGVASGFGALGLAVVGGTAAIGTGLLAYVRFDDRADALRATLEGLGRSAGVTYGDLRESILRAAEAGTLSLPAADDLAQAFLNTGKIATAEMERAIAATRRLAVTLNTTEEDAAAKLAEALANPGEGIDGLAAKMQALDDRTRQYVKTLVAQNRTAEAQRILIDGIVAGSARLETKLNGLPAVFDFVGRAGLNAFNSIGKAVNDLISGQDPLDRLIELKSKQARLLESQRTGSLVPDFFNSNDRALDRVRAEIDTIEKGIAKSRAEARKIADDAKANELSIRAGDISRSVTPGANQLQALKDQQATLRAALESPLARGKLADLAQAEAAYKRLTIAIRDFKPPVDKATEAQRQAGKAALESASSISLLAGAYLKGTVAAQQAEALRRAVRDEIAISEALGRIVAEQSLQGAKQVVELENQVAAQRKVNDAVNAGSVAAGRQNEALQVEQALRPYVAAQSFAEASAKGVLATVIDRLRAAYESLFEQQRRSQAAELIAGGNREIQTLERQIDLIGASTVDRERALTVLRVDQDLRQRGIELSSEQGQQVLNNALRVQQLTSELERQRTATEALDGASMSAIDRFGELLAQGKSDWKSWADAGRSALQEITQELLKLALLNPLKNSLFNSQLPTLGDAKGGLLKDVTDFFARVLHSGGDVGSAGVMRRVPAMAFAGAPRFHSGAYLRSDEVPAILQRGERVLNRREAADYGQSGSQRGRTGGPMVAVTIQTPNPQAFQASQSQVASQLARAVQSGMRGL
jgi:hypothetical protein